MTWADIEDRATSAVVDRLGETGLYNGVTSVSGFHQIEAVEVFDGEMGVNSTRPVFTYSAADLTAETGKSFVVDSITYTIVEIEIDRDLCRLVLEAV